MSALRLAHRGDWRRAPENTIEAMLAALRIPGCDGLEFDVRRAADGVPVVMHDETLARVWGVDRPVAALAAHELEAIGVPTLANLLSAVGSAPFLDVELKERVPGVLAVLGAARGLAGGSAGGLQRAVVSSFDRDILAWLAAERPGWDRWHNVWAPPLGAAVGAARRLGCAGIAAHWLLIDDRAATLVRDAGLQLAAWTVRRRGTYRRLERLGVAAICAEAAALDG